MTGALFITTATVFIFLILVTALVPVNSSFSQFELRRRKANGDGHIELEQLRALLFPDVVSLQRVLQAVLLVAFVLLAVATFGWLFGSVVAVVVALQYGSIARIPLVSKLSERLYGRLELTILEILNRYQHIFRWLRYSVPDMQDARIDSKEELLHMVATSRQVLHEHEKTLITSSLKFKDKLVSEIMTPKSVVDTISKNEILGPLVLDDLHKTGHSRFPVIDEDIDHIVGILYIKNILTLDTRGKHTARVERAMSAQVYYIRDDHSLDQALSAFLSTHHHLFIVINEFRETVGIVTLEDTIETLLGRRIVDEFDAHDDMRAVATRQAASQGSINRSAHSKDI